MDCNRASALHLSAELGSLPVALARELASHLADCPRCAERCRAERTLTACLAELRGAYPLPIDVVGVVLERVDALGAIEREDVGTRQLGLAAAAAVVAAALLSSWTWPLLPVLAEAAHHGGDIAAHLLAAAVMVLQPLLAAFAAGLRVIWSLAGSVLTAFDHAGPAVQVAIRAGHLAMLAGILLIVGRDLTATRTGGDAP